MEPIIQRRSSVLASGVLLLMGGLWSCSAPAGAQDGPDSEIAGDTDPLALQGFPSLWSQNNNVVNVCWTTTGRAAEKDKIKAAIISTWQAKSALTFTWPASADTLCPHTGDMVASKYMPVYVSNDTSFGGVCAVGYGGRQDKTTCGGNMQCQCWISSATDDPARGYNHSVEYAAIHEMGHGLGMIHEHQRIDRDANIQATCTDPNSDPTKWTANSNYAVIDPATLVTKYDASTSMMSYCYDPDHDGIQGELRVDPYPNQAPPTGVPIVPGAPLLGALDSLGIEMVYPFKLNLHPVARGGVGTADGSKYLVRSDRVTALENEWSARGAIASFFTLPTWRDAQTKVVLAETVSMSKTFSGTTSVEVKSQDVLQHNHAYTAATIVASNAAFTGALAPSANQLLL